MKHNLLIPLGHLYCNASGAIEKHMYTCVDFVCTFMLQDKEYKDRETVSHLFHMYLDMSIENDDEEEDCSYLEELKTQEFYEFVWLLYNAMYPYLAPVLKKADWYIYTMDHFQIINSNLFVQLDLDGDEEPLCSLLSFTPTNSSI
jgi:hypothetical protein